jgi:hypothetical protein
VEKNVTVANERYGTATTLDSQFGRMEHPCTFIH